MNWYKLGSPLLVLLGIFLIFGIQVTVGTVAIITGFMLWLEGSK
jgi:hypothetical protein